MISTVVVACVVVAFAGVAGAHPLGLVAAKLAVLPMLYHNIVSFSSGPCSTPDVEATAKITTHSRWEEFQDNAFCVLHRQREPLLFAAKVIAELVTMTFLPGIDVFGIPIPEEFAGYASRFLYAGYVMGGYYVNDWGSWTPPPPGAPGDKTVIARICEIHRRIAARSLAAQPPTLFELLRIDPTTEPLYPPAGHSFPKAPDHHKVQSLIIDAFVKETGHDLADLDAHFVSKEAGGSLLLESSKPNEFLELAAVAHLLLDDAVRWEYMERFIPALRGSDKRIVWENAKDRKAPLESLCPGVFAEVGKAKG